MRSEPRERPAVYHAFALRATWGRSSLEDQFMALRIRELHARNDDNFYSNYGRICIRL